MVNNKDIPKTSFIFKAEKVKTLHDYACEGTTFWKFSQSVKNAQYSYEGDKVFSEYNPGEITSAEDLEMGLSFVRANDIGNCFAYGDQLTKLCFDINNENFRKIMNSYAADVPIIPGEIKTCNLLVEKNYSLSQPWTIAKLISLSDEHSLIHLFYGYIPATKDKKPMTFHEKLFDMKFFESAEFLFSLKNKYDLYNYHSNNSLLILKKNIWNELENFNLEKEYAENMLDEISH